MQAPLRAPDQPSLTEEGNRDRALAEQRRREEEEKRRKAEANRAKGLDPSGRPLKAKDRPQPAGPAPRKLIPDNTGGNKVVLGPSLGIAVGQKVRDLIPGRGKDGGVMGALKETARVIDTGFTKFAEGTAEFAIWGTLAGGSLGTRAARFLKIPVPQLPKSLDPLEKEYRDILINTPTNTPTTTAGRIGADVLAFALATIGVAKRLPPTGLMAAAASKGRGTRALAAGASGIPAGAVADFMLTKPGDPQLANIVRDLPFVKPEDEDTWLLALATNRTDNAFVTKLKATIQGGFVGGAADSLTYLLFARKATQAFIKQGVPEAEALTRGAAVAAEEVQELAKAKGAKEDAKWSQANSQTADEINQRILEAEAKVAEIDARIKGKPPQEGASNPLEAESTTADPSAPSSPPESAVQQANDVDPDEAELQQAMEELNQAYNDRAEFELDLSQDPDQLPAPAKAAFDEEAPLDVAAAEQNRLETTIPRFAKRKDVDPSISKEATVPTLGRPVRVFTDAFYKIIATAPDAQATTLKTIRKSIDAMDLDKIAKASGRPVAGVVRQAAAFVDAFRQADGFYKENTGQVVDGDDLVKMLDEVGLTEIRSASDYGPERKLLTPEGIVAIKTLMVDAANDVYTLSKSLDELLASDQRPGNQLDRLVDRLVTLNELHKLTLYESGYSLRMAQEVIGGNTGKRIELLETEGKSPAQVQAARTKYLKDWATKIKRLAREGRDAESHEELQQLVKALVLAGGDPAKTVSQFSLGMRLGFGAAMDNFYNSILSGPITQFRNAVGGAYSLVERPLSVGLSGMNPFAGDPAKRYAALAAYRGMSDSLGDAFQVMRTTFSTGETLQINRKFVLQDATDQAEILAFRSTAETPGAKAASAFITGMLKMANNRWFNWPGRALAATDDFFKILASRMKISMDAAYEAHSTGLKGADLKDEWTRRYTKAFQEKFHPDHQIKDEALLNYADAATFQDDPGGLVNRIALLLDGAPILRLALPFLRTPANLMSYGAQHFPLLNLASSRYRKIMAMKPGDEGYDPVLQSMMEGRQYVGALFTAAAFMGALEGRITGDGPPPSMRVARELWLRDNRPRSIKAFGQWIGYESIEPLNNFLALAADAAMVAKMGHLRTAEGIASQLSFSLAASIVDKSYLAGLTSVSAFLDPRNQTNPDWAARGVFSTVNNVLPLAGARRMMANTLNPYVREIDGELQRVLSVAVPGYAMSMQYKIDPLTGEPFTSLSGGFWNANSPFRIQAAEFPKGTPEHLGQKVAIGLSEANWDSSALTFTTDKGEEVPADERAAYAKAMYEVGLPKRLDFLFNTPYYKQALAAFKQREMQLEPRNSEHYRLIDDRIRDVKREARALMLQRSPKWQKRADLVNQRNRAQATGQIKQADELQKLIESMR